MANSSTPERVKVTRVCKCIKTERVDRKDGKNRAVFLDNLRWDNNDLITVSFHQGGDFTTCNLTFSERKEFVKHTINRTIIPLVNLRFIWLNDNDPTAFIRIKFDSGDGAWSYVGKECLQVDGPEATMNLGWLDCPEENGPSDEGSVIIHEFGHVLGLVHEHQSKNFPYVWDRDRVISELTSAPNYWTESMIEQNIFGIFDSGNSQTSEYDPNSIMHYYFPQEFFNPQTIIPYNTSLSTRDIEIIQGMYPATYGCGSETISENRIRINSGLEPFTVLLIISVILVLGIGLTQIYRRQKKEEREKLGLTIICHEPRLRGTIQ